MFRFFFLGSWSTEEKLSAAVLYGGSFSVLFSIWGALRTLLPDDCVIDAMSVNLYLLAGASGIATLTFGTWLVLRHLGFSSFRWLAVVFGVIGVSAWPVMDYVCGQTLVT
jgi:hypothetical protein